MISKKYQNQSKAIILTLIILLITMPLMAGCCKTQKEENLTGVMWKVEKGDTTVYFLGGIHVSEESMYPINEKIIKALEGSDEAYFEIDFGKQLSKEDLEAITKNSQLEMGKNLEDLLTDEEYALLIDKLSEVGIEISTVRNLKPLQIISTYSSIILQDELKLGVPVDQYIYNLAKEQNKEIHELESAKYELDILFNLSLELQVKWLLETLRSDELITQVKKEMDYWSTGNLEAFEKESEEGLKNADWNQALIDEYQEKLLYERNEKMADKIDALLKQNDGKTYFITVGLGHFVGEKSIVELLEKMGYEVDEY